MFKSLKEAFAAWKGQRHMARESNQTGFGMAPPSQRTTRTDPSALFPSSSGKDPQEDKIRVRAYLLAEAAGFPAGRADEFWHQAEREIRPVRGR